MLLSTYIYVTCNYIYVNVFDKLILYVSHYVQLPNSYTETASVMMPRNSNVVG